MSWAPLLWPVLGWFFAFISTPKWMLKHDPFGYFLIFFCGAVVGPFGVFFWLLQRSE